MLVVCKRGCLHTQDGSTRNAQVKEGRESCLDFVCLNEACYAVREVRYKINIECTSLGSCYSQTHRLAMAKYLMVKRDT